jgi:hypothetical protein
MAIAISSIPQAQMAQQVRRQRRLDDVFRYLTLGLALAVLLVLGGVLLALIRGAWPALSTFGFGFLATEVWNPVTEKFGALAPIYGTLVTSATHRRHRRAHHGHRPCHARPGGVAALLPDVHPAIARSRAPPSSRWISSLPAG